MHFASLLSGGFITAIVVNPPEGKLAKRTSVQCTFMYVRVTSVWGRGPNRSRFSLKNISLSWLSLTYFQRQKSPEYFWFFFILKILVLMNDFWHYHFLIILNFETHCPLKWCPTFWRPVWKSIKDKWKKETKKFTDDN